MFQEGGGSESSSNSNVSLKNAQDSDKHRSNTSSDMHSDSSDSSNNKAGLDVKCGRTNLDYREKSRAVLLKESSSKSEQESDQEKDPSRRPSKDESSSFSSDSPSGDEYHIYYYDSKAVANVNGSGKDKNDSDGNSTPNVSTVLGNLTRTEDLWDVLFARAEGLYAHGHTREACILGVKLGEELLANPPNLMDDPRVQGKGKKRKVDSFGKPLVPLLPTVRPSSKWPKPCAHVTNTPTMFQQHVTPPSHKLTCLASATLAKCCFLCTVLAENPECHNLAFRVGLFGLEMARPPANTKSFEVHDTFPRRVEQLKSRHL